MSALPSFDDVMKVEGRLIRWLAFRLGVDRELASAAAWLAWQRSQRVEPENFQRRFRAKLKNELLAERARRSAPACAWPCGQDGTPIDFPAPASEKIERWRTASLTEGEEERLACLGAGSAAIAQRLGKTRRRAQQKIVEDVGVMIAQRALW